MRFSWWSYKEETANALADAKRGLWVFIIISVVISKHSGATKVESALLLGFVLLLSVNIASLYVLYQLIKQRGRLLLRLDQVEYRLNEIERIAHPIINGVENGSAYSSDIVVGSLLPRFQARDLTGKMVGLENFRGQRVLFIHWDPRSEQCQSIAPELAKLQSEFHYQKAQIVLVSSQDGELNRRLAQEQGLVCPILLTFQESNLKAFQNMGTPAAYLLDEEGRVISPQAFGTSQVLALAREAITIRMIANSSAGHFSLNKSRIEREGLKAGTIAPSFTLPTINGVTVSLAQYYGRRVLLVFTSPHCAPCDYLAPYLVRLYQQCVDNHLALLMIGRGDVEENQRKAELYGFQFPVALQKHWEISKLYGIFSTPVAFLVDETGVIAKNVAKGVDEILTLVQEGLAIAKEVNSEPVI